MLFRRLLILFLGTFLTVAFAANVRGQGCTPLGQSPSTAFPVCGTSVFKQENVPHCDGSNIPVPCGDNAQYKDINPYWYKFTCFSGGTLGFTIKPNTTTDDYDWQIFDVTGHSPNSVYTDPSLFVSGNWSSNDDATGTGNNNNGSVNCAGPAYPNMNSMPTLIQGHEYLLLISHFTDINQSGYSLSFGGGTASITDVTPPALQSAEGICFGSTIRIVLNKKMRCASLAADGSDFTVSPLPAGVSVIGATAAHCSSGFDLDTVTLTLNGDLPLNSNYTVAAANGTDGNTLVDVCGNQVTAGQFVSFLLGPPPPTPIDHLTPLTCAPQVLQLNFTKKKIQCSSIAADGSDFTISGGSAPVTVVGASATCDGSGLTSVVFVRLSAPIQTKGDYQINLHTGSDGNTVLDECSVATLAASLPFSTLDTVSADIFTDQLLLGCKYDTIVYDYPTKDGVNQWQWIFDGQDTSLLQHPPQRIYSVFGAKTVQLIVSNGFCSDTSRATPLLDNTIQAKFEAPNILCPKDYAQFVNNSTGKLNSWTWDFGDGTTDNQETPPDHLFPLTGIETNYSVRLIIGNALGCYDTAIQKVDVLRSCYIAVPTAFTPNGDGLNDYLYPLNAFKADNLVFQVFNRQGQMVFETHDWTQKWDGRIQGHAAPAGVYAWFLQYTDRDSGKKFFQKGTSILIR